LISERETKPICDRLASVPEIAEAGSTRVTDVPVEDSPIPECDELLTNPEINTGGICAPDFSHDETGIAAGQAGKPFWINKPFGRIRSKNLLPIGLRGAYGPLTRIPLALDGHATIDCNGQARDPEADAGWSAPSSNLEQIRIPAVVQGTTASLCPHGGPIVENADDVDKVLDSLTSSLHSDTENFLSDGMDRDGFSDDYVDRVAPTPVEDLPLSAMHPAENVQQSSFDWILADERDRSVGQVNVDIRSILGCRGWFVLERGKVLASEPPLRAGPLADLADACSPA
jgi:hypothetical protein